LKAVHFEPLFLVKLFRFVFRVIDCEYFAVSTGKAKGKIQMQHNLYKKYFRQLLTIVLSIGLFGGLVAKGQERDRVLVGGNPALRHVV